MSKKVINAQVEYLEKYNHFPLNMLYSILQYTDFLFNILVLQKYFPVSQRMFLVTQGNIRVSSFLSLKAYKMHFLFLFFLIAFSTTLPLFTLLNRRESLGIRGRRISGLRCLQNCASSSNNRIFLRARLVVFSPLKHVSILPHHICSASHTEKHFVGQPHLTFLNLSFACWLSPDPPTYL